MKYNAISSTVMRIMTGAIVGVLVFCIGHLLIAFPVSAQNAQPQAPPAEEAQLQPAQSPPPVILSPPAEKSADELFKEGAAKREKDPEEAIRIYQRAIQMKPDAWAERKKLAGLYEKQGKLNAAANEYEMVNGVTGSAESFKDLVRVLEKEGLVNAASRIAQSGAVKFPDDKELVGKAGGLLLKASQADRAMMLLRKAVEKWPDDGQMLYLFGQSCEKNGKDSDAMRAYLRAASRPGPDKDAKAAVDRLGSKALRLEGIWIFPPQGFVREGDRLVNILEDQKVAAQSHGGADARSAALRTLQGEMPAGMFSDEKLKEYDRIRQVAAEMAKTSPDFARQVPPPVLPVFSEKPLPGSAKGLLVIAATAEEPSSPFFRSVCVMVFPRGDKTYTISWISTKSRTEGEKMVPSLLEQIVFPL